MYQKISLQRLQRRICLLHKLQLSNQLNWVIQPRFRVVNVVMLQPATAIGLRLTLANSVSADLLLLLQNIGFDATLAIFLIAAFLDDNLLSLVFMLFMALGMGMKHRARSLTWRYLVLPCWILLLLWQYVVLVGWHPFSNHRGAFPHPLYFPSSKKTHCSKTAITLLPKAGCTGLKTGRYLGANFQCLVARDCGSPHFSM